MGHHRISFEDNGVDDFLVLPYLRPNILEDMGVTSAADRGVIMRAVKRLQDLTQLQCKFNSFPLGSACLLNSNYFIS